MCLYRTIVLLLICASCCLHAADKEAKLELPIFGDWVDSEDNRSFVRFERDRFIGNESGTNVKQFLRASYTDTAVTFYVQGQSMDVPYQIKDNQLLAEWPGEGQKTFKRLKKTPSELLIPVMEFGKTDKVSKKEIRALCKELAQRIKRDQEARKNPAKQHQMANVDAENTAWLKKQLAQYGWIDGKRFGAEAADHAFLIVQHSGDLPLMQAALPCIEADIKARSADGQNFALLFDRFQLKTGRKQRYGSQFNITPQAVEIFALEDPEHVEQRRREIGVFPLALYLKVIQQQTGIKKIVFLE